MGREYTSNKFYQLFTLDRTIHQTSCTDTPEQNEVAEKKHMHIVKTTHSLLLFAFIPNMFWRKVILNVVSLNNTILFFSFSQVTGLVTGLLMMYLVIKTLLKEIWI